jgi:hypothetical protein
MNIKRHWRLKVEVSLPTIAQVILYFILTTINNFFTFIALTCGNKQLRDDE